MKQVSSIKPKDLLSNKDWKLTELQANSENNVFAISSKDGKDLGWVIKVYNDKIFAERESQALEKLKGVIGIPKLITTSENHVVMTKLPGIDLFYHLEKNGSLEEEEVKRLALQLFQILSQIHERGVIHGDIKLENLIYDEASSELGLIDFERKHTLEYLSPEYILKGEITEKSDIWAAGVLIYSLLSNKFPHGELDDEATGADRQLYKTKILAEDIKFKKEWSDDLQDFLGCLLERDPRSRYSANDALNHPWLEL